MEDYKQMPGIAEQSRAQQSWGEFCRPGHFYEPSCPHFVLKTWGKKKKKTLTCQEQIETLPSRVIIIQSFRITQYHTLIQFTGKQIVTVKYTAIKWTLGVCILWSGYSLHNNHSIIQCVSFTGLFYYEDLCKMCTEQVILIDNKKQMWICLGMVISPKQNVKIVGEAVQFMWNSH